MKETKTTCDWCGKNVKENALWYSLEIMVGNTSYEKPKIPDATHFCSLQCIHDYFKKVIYD